MIKLFSIDKKSQFIIDKDNKHYAFYLIMFQKRQLDKNYFESGEFNEDLENYISESNFNKKVFGAFKSSIIKNGVGERTEDNLFGIKKFTYTID